jgi:flagellin-like hook-associated protein FlgL
MSGAIGVSSYSTLDQLLASDNSLNTQYAALQAQTSTGLVSQSYSGLASVSSQVLDLTATINQGNAYTQNITQAQGQASAMQNVLTQLGSLVSNMAASTVTISSSTPSSTVTSLAQQASNDLSQVAALLNTTYEGNYVFSGADTANPPVTSPDGLTSSSSFTNIGSLVSTFTGGSGTTSASALISNASSIMATGGTFSSYLTAAATNPVTPPQVEIGPSEYVTVGLPATQNVGAASDPSGTGSAITDILGSLAVIANSTSAMASGANFTTLMQNVSATLTSAGNTLAQESGYIGQSQDTMTAAANVQSSAQTVLATQLSNLTDVDMPTAISNMQEVSNQLQTSYTVLGEVSKLNLASYL